MPDQLSVDDFAQKVKARFPQFHAVDNADLTRKILERRPELINQIQTSQARPALQRDDTSTMGSVVQGLKNVGSSLTSGMYEQSKVRAGEGVPPEAVGVPMPGAFIKNSVDDFLDGLKNTYEAGQQARQEGEGTAGVTLREAEQLPIAGPLVKKVESGLNAKDLAGPWYKPVLPNQGLEAVTEAAGYAAAPEALKKAGEGLVKGASAVMGPKAIQGGAQSILGIGPKLTEKAVTNANDVIGANAEKTDAVAQRQKTEADVQQRATKLGEGIKELEENVRKNEVNPRYEAVRKAVASDPGIPLAELAKEASHAEQNILKGSQESIKQFRELIRGAPEAQGVETSAGFTKPGEPLYDQLASEGAIDQGGNLPFDQLQGYYSEIGSKLARGGLEGDVYQALKYVQEKIGAAKAKIAERNGAGPQLKEADSYYRTFMDTFHNTDAIKNSGSPVAHALQASDPGYYETPFTGKGGERGIKMLRNYSPELADLADQVRRGRAEANALPKTAKTQDVPELDPRTLKEEKLSKKAEAMSEANRYDVRILLGSAIGAMVAPFVGHSPAIGLLGFGAEAAKLGTGAMLDRPSVVKWLTQPQEADLAALKKLPPDVQNGVRNNMKNFVSEEQAAGTPFTVSPAVTKFLTGSAAESDKKKPTDLKAAGASLAQ